MVKQTNFATNSQKVHIWEYIIMLRDFHSTQAGDKLSRPIEIYIIGYNCNGVKMAGDRYLLNTTLFWVVCAFALLD